MTALADFLPKNIFTTSWHGMVLTSMIEGLPSRWVSHTYSANLDNPSWIRHTAQRYDHFYCTMPSNGPGTLDARCVHMLLARYMCQHFKVWLLPMTYFGTTTNRVTRYSESSTKSLLCTSSAMLRVKRLPLQTNNNEMILVDIGWNIIIYSRRSTRKYQLLHQSSTTHYT